MFAIDKTLVSRRSLQYFSQAVFLEVRALPLRSRDKTLLLMEEMDYLAAYPWQTVSAPDLCFWNMLFYTRDE